MAKVRVTVPVFIGGKPYVTDDVAEVDDYEARLLIGMGRAVPQADPVPLTDPVADEAGEEEAVRRGRKKT